MRLTATRSSLSGSGAVLDPITQEGPTLDFNFADSKALLDDVGSNNPVTFTRASSATYVGADGLITTAATDEPRFDHDPATGESLGLLIEENRTNLVTHSDLSSDASPAGATITASTEVNPQGAASCRRLLSVAGANSSDHRIKRIGNTSAPSNNITVSVFVKKDTHRYVLIGCGGTTHSFTALFDIEPSLTGDRLLGQSGKGTYTNINAGYENYANGWVRIFASGTTTGGDGFTIGLSPNASTYVINTWTADGTEAVFLHGAQYENNVTYPTSYIPTSGSTVTRAADIAKIDGADFAKTNLLQYSERFDQSYWSKIRGFISPNTTVAPDGTSTADTWSENDETDAHNLNRAISLTDNTNYTASVYVKAAGRTTCRLGIRTKNNQYPGAYFDLTSGTVISEIAGPVSTSIDSVGNGWYRLNITANSVTGSSTPKYILWSTDGANLNPVGIDGPALHVWGAQLEEGSVLTEYTPSVESFVSRASTATYVDDATGLIKTAAVDEARYENNELILEEARTNLLLRSEVVNSWFKVRASVTANNAISPAGDLTADTLIENTDNNTHLVKRGIGVQSGNTYTGSVFVKAAGRTKLKFGFTSANFPTSTRGAFDLEAGTAVESYNTITDFGNGWYRITATNTADATGNAQLSVDIANDNGDTLYTGDGTSGIHVWGGQVEEGAFASSYIATDTSTVTRAADVSTSALGVDSFYNHSEGTFYTEFSAPEVELAIDSRALSVLEGTLATGSLHISKRNGVNQFLSAKYADGTKLNIGSIDWSNSQKAVLSYNSTDYTLVSNGSTRTANSTAVNPNLHRLFIGCRTAGNNLLNGHIKRLSYIPTRLPDATLQDLTEVYVPPAFLEYTTASVSLFQVRTAGTVNYDVDWGDGSTDTGVTDNRKNHIYSSAGVYTIRITPAAGSTFRPLHQGSTDYQTSLTKVDGTGGSQLGTNLQGAFRASTAITSIGSFNTSSVITFTTSFENLTGLTSFPALNTSSGTTFFYTWNGCTGLTSFPLIDTSAATILSNAWFNCSGLTSFPAINTSNAEDIRSAWNGCTGLTSFPALDFSSATSMRAAWRNCTSLATYPANQFDTTGTLVSNAFELAFLNCALTAQSIENILTSLDTNGSSNITLSLNNGTNAAKSTWSTAANTAYTNLINKGWTITFNS